jgi:hypothetical protein
MVRVAAKPAFDVGDDTDDGAPILQYHLDMVFDVCSYFEECSAAIVRLVHDELYPGVENIQGCPSGSFQVHTPDRHWNPDSFYHRKEHVLCIVYWKVGLW